MVLKWLLTAMPIGDASSPWDAISAVGVAVGGIASLIAAVLGVTALAIARGQLRTAIEASAAATRPYVVVSLVPDRPESLNPCQVFFHRLTIVIENIGASPARDIAFKTSPALQRDAMSPGLRDLLSGDATLPILGAHQRVRHQLDQVGRNTREFTKEQKDINVRVDVKYTDIDGKRSWKGSFPIVIGPFENVLYGPDPLVRIAKDIQQLNSTVKSGLKDIKTSLSSN